MKCPNILFLMSDEHRADVSGFEGNKVVRTPCLDRLAETGVRFSHCYAPSPVCVPGRQAMMAGRYCHSLGVLGFWDDLHPFEMTFARRFAQHGYRTVCCGKLHHHGQDQMQGWTHRPVGDLSVAARYVEGRVACEHDRPPAEAGTGKWSMQKEVERAGVGDGPCQIFDAAAVDGAIRFIYEHFNSSAYDRPQRHQPMLLKVSLIQPHYPFFTDQAKFDYYLNRVPVFDEKAPAEPLCQKHRKSLVQATARERRRATAAYYGMIETIDQQFQRVIDALHQVGQSLDDWIVIYTSDHGEMLGQHGLWEKNSFFEASVRVPLVMRWPGILPAGMSVEQNVNLIDLFATLCELAGISVPEGLDSRSFVPLIRGDGGSWENVTLSWESQSKGVMVKQDEFKYMTFGDGTPEVFFDLATDPGETRNGVNDVRYAEVLKSLRQREARVREQVNAGKRM